MDHCEKLLDHLDDAVEDRLPLAMSEHLKTCTTCQETVARALDDAAVARLMREIEAPRALVERLSRLHRLPPACERAQELFRAALDDELPEDGRTELLDHLHDCPTCTLIWESFATLREVGSQVRPSRHLRAALALPPRHRLHPRRPKRLLDLRLATAAAYLVAAASIVFVGNPATIARASGSVVDRAGLYARAAVENRFSAYSHKVKETLAVGEHWVREQAVEAWQNARSLLGKDQANPQETSDVTPGENGGNR